ncbi:MAG TPA: hypothetical protein PLS66_04275 [Tepiditoga sp.]|nr:hypothetical protein [Tepiditoga sp.]
MRFAFGLIIIVIGVLLLFGTINVNIFFNVINNFFTVWPIIFIFIGLSIISKIEGFKWVKWINSILSILFVIYLFFFPGQNYSAKIYEGNETIPITENFEEIYIDIDCPISNMKINFEDSTDEIAFKYSSLNTQPEIDSFGNRIKIDTTPGIRYFIPSSNPALKLELIKGIKYYISIDSGISKVEADNLNNYIKELNINSGIINVTVNNLRDGNYSYGETKFDFDTAILNMKIYTPSETTYDYDIDTAFKTFDVSSGIIRNSENPDMYFNIDSAFSNITIKKSDNSF